MKRSGRLTPDQAAGWVVRLCKRIVELHRLGVAHGGLSPHVILTQDRDVAAAGMLGDVRQAATRPSFHSPERLAGGAISTADDCWGAACSLFFLATGQLPFPGITTQEIAASVARLRCPSLATYGLTHPDLEAVIGRFLLADPAQRASDLVALQRELEAIVPAAAGLPPLDDGEEESLNDFEEEDEEDAATVMRDFSAVRAQILAERKRKGLGDPTGGEAPDLPAPAAPRPPPGPPPPTNLAPIPNGDTGLPAPFADEDSDEDDGATQLLDTDGLFEEGLEAAIKAHGDPTGGPAPAAATGPAASSPAVAPFPPVTAGPGAGGPGPVGAQPAPMAPPGASPSSQSAEVPPPGAMPAPAAGAEGSGLKVALAVATGLLVLVMIWVGLLLLERFGYVALPV